MSPALRQQSLFSFDRPENSWRPEPPPELQAGEAVAIDFEYKGAREALRAEPIAVSVYSPARKKGWYLPWGHEGGGNLPEEIVKRWYEHELRGRDVYGLNIKAELHSTYNWGLDPEEIGIRPHDVAYASALLDENRIGHSGWQGFSLEALAEKHLPAGERKVHPSTVDPDKFYLAHAGEVAERGISDSYLAWRLHEVMQPCIEAESLQKVLDLEDRAILPTVGMERTGALIDRPKLERWCYQADEKINGLFKQISDATGLRVNPNKDRDMRVLFEHLGMKVPVGFDEKTKVERETFEAEQLKAIKHPVIQMALDLKRTASLKSKYLSKYLKAIDKNSVLHYQLHQLRTGQADGEDDYGTVTGRYSCGGGKFAINIQQVMKCEKQIEELGPDFIIRELFIPRAGLRMGASDASQIEFRLFGHYSGSRDIIEAYRLDPMIDFHMMVTQMMNPGVTDKAKLKALRKHMKHNNFGVLYGMGRPELARRLGLGCTCSVDWDERNDDGRRVNLFYKNDHHFEGCPARQANDIMDEYDAKFSQAKALRKKASNLAKVRKYVFTLLGRRRRYPDGRRLHSALNAVIQGSAADYFKLKLIELWENRRTLGIELRMPVHDEFVYDIDPDPIYQARVQELLDTQSLDLKVPLLFETGIGDNWRQANGQ